MANLLPTVLDTLSQTKDAVSLIIQFGSETAPKLEKNRLLRGGSRPSLPAGTRTGKLPLLQIQRILASAIAYQDPSSIPEANLCCKKILEAVTHAFPTGIPSSDPLHDLIQRLQSITDGVVLDLENGCSSAVNENACSTLAIISEPFTRGCDSVEISSTELIFESPNSPITQHNNKSKSVFEVTTENNDREIRPDQEFDTSKNAQRSGSKRFVFRKCKRLESKMESKPSNNEPKVSSPLYSPKRKDDKVLRLAATENGTAMSAVLDENNYIYSRRNASNLNRRILIFQCTHTENRRKRCKSYIRIYLNATRTKYTAAYTGAEHSSRCRPTAQKVWLPIEDGTVHYIKTNKKTKYLRSTKHDKEVLLVGPDSYIFKQSKGGGKRFNSTTYSCVSGPSCDAKIRKSKISTKEAVYEKLNARTSSSQIEPVLHSKSCKPWKLSKYKTNAVIDTKNLKYQKKHVLFTAKFVHCGKPKALNSTSSTEGSSTSDSLVSAATPKSNPTEIPQPPPGNDENFKMTAQQETQMPPFQPLEAEDIVTPPILLSQNDVLSHPAEEDHSVSFSLAEILKIMKLELQVPSSGILEDYWQSWIESNNEFSAHFLDWADHKKQDSLKWRTTCKGLPGLDMHCCWDPVNEILLYRSTPSSPWSNKCPLPGCENSNRIGLYCGIHSNKAAVCVMVVANKITKPIPLHLIYTLVALSTEREDSIPPIIQVEKLVSIAENNAAWRQQIKEERHGTTSVILHKLFYLDKDSTSSSDAEKLKTTLGVLILLKATTQPQVYSCLRKRTHCRDLDTRLLNILASNGFRFSFLDEMTYASTRKKTNESKEDALGRFANILRDCARDIHCVKPQVNLKDTAAANCYKLHECEGVRKNWPHVYAMSGSEITHEYYGLVKFPTEGQVISKEHLRSAKNDSSSFGGYLRKQGLSIAKKEWGRTIELAAPSLLEAQACESIAILSRLFVMCHFPRLKLINTFIEIPHKMDEKDWKRMKAFVGKKYKLLMHWKFKPHQNDKYVFVLPEDYATQSELSPLQPEAGNDCPGFEIANSHVPESTANDPSGYESASMESNDRTLTPPEKKQKRETILRRKI